MTVEIANIVGSGDLGVEVDLKPWKTRLVHAAPFLEYDPSNYHGLYVRLEEGGPLITVYRSSKYIISGCPGEKELRETNDGFLRTLAELGITDEAQQTRFTVQNVVCTRCDAR